MSLKTTLCVLCLFALFSCRNNVAVNSDTDFLFDGKDTGSAYIPYGGFYQSPLESDSTFFCFHAAGNNQSFFYSDTLNLIYASKCKLNGKLIDTLKTIVVLENEWAYLTIDSSSFRQVTVHGEPYMYLSTSEGFMGQNMIERNVNFHLVNMNTLQNYRLLYAGEPSFKCEGCIEGRYVITDQLKKTPEILSTLIELSKSSKYIYQRGAKDEDIYYHLNYELKWDKDNRSHNAYAAGYGDIVTPIYSTYYKTNLFTLNRGSENDVIENNKYKLIAYFRGNIIGYDKKKEMYFPLYIENCVLSCDKTIEFVGDDGLKIKRSELEDEVYLISLKDIIFDKKTGD